MKHDMTGFIITPFRAAAAILAAACATIAGAWIYQALGYQPCELCLRQRIPYYLAILLAAPTLYFARGGFGRLLPYCFAALALLFAAAAALGAWHAGIEWGFWPGPSDCTGPLAPAGSIADFLKDLRTTKVARCDEVALRVFGLSLAVWNVLIASGLAALAAWQAKAAHP